MSFISAADADKNTYDVIVVGSGAAGGQTAYTLTMDGARVLMLEAGRNYIPATETPMLQTNGDAPLRGSGTPEKPFGFWDARRTHQPLGAHFPAKRSLRLQATHA